MAIVGVAAASVTVVAFSSAVVVMTVATSIVVPGCLVVVIAGFCILRAWRRVAFGLHTLEDLI